MGIFVVCIICKNTVDFDKIKDYSDIVICNKCLNSVPSYVPESQQYYWLKKKKSCS